MKYESNAEFLIPKMSLKNLSLKLEWIKHHFFFKDRRGRTYSIF